MKINYTHIVGVESNEHSVKIKFRPQGSDDADEPLSVQITPLNRRNGTSLILNLNFAEFTTGGNTMDIPIKKI